MKNKTRLSISIPNTMYDYIERKAWSLGLSKNAVILLMLNEVFKSDKKRSREKPNKT